MALGLSIAALVLAVIAVAIAVGTSLGRSEDNYYLSQAIENLWARLARRDDDDKPDPPR
jgi:hypothetical protein